ncbi:MAG: glycosyltransferase [Acidobacteria bacterium]|nr:glycosyltransferase [Acidobacteriota bacterium]
MKITFLVRALNLGGAQTQMVVLAKKLQERGHQIQVIAFYDGVHKKTLLESNVAVHTLDKRGRWDVIGFLWRLIKLVRHQSPDVLYGYLATSNLLTSFLRLFVPQSKAVWGLRVADLKLEYYGWLSRLLCFLEQKLAWTASLVIANSQAGMRFAVGQGVPAKKIIAIPNGIDIEKFYPDESARKRTRAAWKVAANELLIGIVGRIDPIKEHKVFLSAAARLRQQYPNARFACVGESVNNQYQEELYALVETLGLQQSVIWTGAQYDMLGVYNSLDLLTNSSSSEGFSNVIGEAMACGVPCVVTDVGDSALIVSSAGVVVSVNDPAALVSGWLACLRQQSPELGAQARQRICREFSVSALVDRTEATLMAIG